MKTPTSGHILKKTLLAAAALMAAVPVAKAYNLGDWATESNRYYGGNNNFSGSLDSFYSLGFTQTRAHAGAFQIDGAYSDWFGNDYGIYFLFVQTGLGDSYTYQSIVANGVGTVGNSVNGYYASGVHTFISSSVLMPTGTNSLDYTFRFDQTDGTANFHANFGYSERAVQVAFTRAGFGGDVAPGAFASDNSVTLNPANYDASHTALNVLPTAHNNAGTVILNGAVVYGTSLTVGTGEGLFAKDGGWLDIRGNLVVYGNLMIRDAEITADRFYGNGSLGSQFESGILSVRNTFAQDMHIQGNKTLGLRDGAVNAANVYIQGDGYTGGSGMSGALRSITGTNVQNGFVGIEWAGGEGGNYSVISADNGSNFIINGAVNGTNGISGVWVEYKAGAGAQIVQNGHIGGFISDVNKTGLGDLRLTTSNTFTGDVKVYTGSVTVAHSEALAAGASTYVYNEATLVFDGSASALSISENVTIEGAGTTGSNGAIRNLAGANTLTGQVTLNLNSLVTVAAGSSLTISGDLATSGGNAFALDINTETGEGTTSSLSVTGHTGNIFHINKHGGGTATIGTADADLLSASVTAGKLVLSASSSTEGSRFGAFTKGGEGTLELGGAHYFSGYSTDAGVTNVVGLLNSGVTATTSAIINVRATGSTDGAVAASNSAAFNVLASGTHTGTITLSDQATASIAGSSTGAVVASNTSGVTVTAGGLLTGNVTLWNDATVNVSGTSIGSPAVVTNGTITGNITANNNSTVTLGSYGIINGDVTILNNARFIIAAYSTHNGDFNSSDNSHITIDGHLTDTGLFASNFLVSGSARLDGHGIIDGNVRQTGGVVAPGNSPGILTVGTYTNNGGLLDIEIANNTGAAGVGYDQLRVTSTAATAIQVSNPVNYSTIQFTDYALLPAGPYVGARRDWFQVIADGNGNARNTFDKFDLVSYSSGSVPADRMLFDHSTGRAYGTGLDVLTGTFRDYGVTANQKEIGRALWMESIAYDKNTGITDENFASTALDPVAAAAQRGYKAWILTNHDAALGEQATDLGQAAVSVLLAPNAALALDALSPESYVGLADQGARIARGFARLPFAPRNAGSSTVVAGWDFDIGYLNDELRSDSSSAYTSYKASSNQYDVSASRAFGENVRVTLGVGYDDGRISSQGFNADVNTIGFGAGLVYTPYSKKWNFAVGVGLTTADWKSERGASLAKEDNQQSLSVAGRVSLAPLTKGDFSFTPYVGLAYARSRIGGFSETDVPGSVQLAVDGFSHQSLQSELGASLDYRIKPTTVISAVIGWDHEFRQDGETDVTAQFIEAGVTDTKFKVRSTGFGTNLFRAGLSLRHDLTPSSSIRLGYDAIMGSNVSDGRQIHADYSVRF